MSAGFGILVYNSEVLLCFNISMVIFLWPYDFTMQSIKISWVSSIPATGSDGGVIMMMVIMIKYVQYM